MFESILLFCYLCDISAGGGGVEESIVARIMWLEEIQGNHYFQGVYSVYKSFQTFARSVVLNGSETWAVKGEYLAKLKRNDMAWHV